MARNPAVSYGRDVACLLDADPLLSSVTGIDVVRQAAYHRLMCDDILGPGGDGWGYDCRRMLGMKSSQLSAMQPVLSEVLQRDQRILTADVHIRAVRANGLDDVRIDVRCTTDAGPFSFVMSVADLTAATIEGQVR